MIVGSSAVISCRKRTGITLTEILISIMILGIGMVSLATLFPLGLLKLRDAARFSRSAYLAESAAADLAARGLMSKQSFKAADIINVGTSPLDSTFSWSYSNWYSWAGATAPNPYGYDPFMQDTPAYSLAPTDTSTTPPTPIGVTGSRGLGLPIAYDPLWRWQAIWNGNQGLYLDPVNQNTPEARFASGIGFVRVDPGDSGTASVYGLQRLTNFNGLTASNGTTTIPIMPISQYVPSIFVSPEDIVWQDANYKLLYPMAWGLSDPVTSLSTVDSTPSPLVPDLSISNVYNATTSTYVNTYLPVEDWRYTWMFTGRQVSEGSSSGATFDGEIVVFENRPFALDQVVSPIDSNTYPQAAGERVVEAVFGYATNTVPIGTDSNGNTINYGLGANKTVLLRWPATSPDPEIKVGSWIADVTYERTLTTSLSRFFYNLTATAVFAPSTSGQRCHWYQVVKINPAAVSPVFSNAEGAYRSMVVNVATPLRALTPLSADGTGTPYHVNAALVSPYVIQVIPRTFTVN